MSNDSKIISRTDRQTHKQTHKQTGRHTHREEENTTLPTYAERKNICLKFSDEKDKKRRMLHVIITSQNTDNLATGRNYLYTRTY